VFGLAAALGCARADELKLAVLGPEGADTPGDRLSVNRPFGSWSLQCDLSVVQNKRLCGVEQVLEQPGGAVLWRLARASDDRNVLVFSLPLNLDTARGLTVKLDGFATVVTTWNCQKACLALVPLTATLQSLLFSAATVEMSYMTTAGRPVVLTGSMAGFRAAIMAAAEVPFGKRVPPPAPKMAARPVEATGSVVAERMKKPKHPAAPATTQ
jgi:invasion protein IalB